MQIDYIIGIGIFLSIFIAVAFFVLGYMNNTITDLKIANLKSYAISLLDMNEHESFGERISERGIGTRAWRAIVSVESQSEIVSEVSHLKLSEIGLVSADLNSVAIYTSPAYGTSLPFLRSADTISWSTRVPIGTTI